MKESLRLSVPAPCTENWDKMLPAEKGRHCQQCCKTVVDFTGMTDEEILGFFKGRAGTGSRADARSGVGLGAERAGDVCGRFFAGQLRRELAPAPVQRNGMKGWQWVVASALVLGKGPDGGGPVKAGVDADTSVRVVPDTSYATVTTGIPVITVGDVVEVPVRDSVLIKKIGTDDSVSEMPADTVTAVPIGKPKDEAFTGLVRIVPDTPSYTGKLMDTVSGIKARVDTAINFLKDTVAAMVPGLVTGPRQEELLNVYPNPVMRGGMMRLAWRGDAGTYSAELLDLHRQIVAERMIYVAGEGQVDDWAVPNGLAAGIYFLWVVRPGEKGYTVEVLVQ